MVRKFKNNIKIEIKISIKNKKTLENRISKINLSLRNELIRPLLVWSLNLPKSIFDRSYRIFSIGIQPKLAKPTAINRNLLKLESKPSTFL